MTDCPTYSGWSITKSSTPYRNVDFKVISRLLSFNFVSFFFLLDRYGKADPGGNLRLVRASLSSRCCWIATAKLSSFFSSFASSISFVRCWIATAKLSSLFVSFLPLFSSCCCWIATAKLPSHLISFVATFSSRCCWIATAELSSSLSSSLV